MTGTDELFDAMFGEGAWSRVWPDPILRGIRLKIQPTGHLTVAHPKADGPSIIKIQQVPANVSTADVLRRMDNVYVARRDKTLHYSEIKTGAILR
jgi:hypothetical protein